MPSNEQRVAALEQRITPDVPIVFIRTFVSPGAIDRQAETASIQGERFDRRADECEESFVERLEREAKTMCLPGAWGIVVTVNDTDAVSC